MAAGGEAGRELTDTNTFLLQQGYVAIPIEQNAAGHLLIAVKVNGVSGLFILDTGAGGSVVDAAQASLLNLILQHDDRSLTGAGAGGLGLVVIPAHGNRVEIEDYVLTDFPLMVMSLEHVSQALAQVGAHETVVGVIGVDILKPGKAIIDYGSMTLYLASNNEANP